MNYLNLSIKIANQPWELEEVCRLNHQTFSEEIPQHEKTSSGLLVDKFHSENQYIICQYGKEIIGMVALRTARPFSLDLKLENIEQFLPPHKSLCEIRLLSVKPEYRSSRVFFLLFEEGFRQFIKNQYDYGLISGILSQQKLYRSIGFVPFGPLVGDTVKFQPMYCSPDFFFRSRHIGIALRLQNKRVNLLPGPVDIKTIISEEYNKKPVSHRSADFVEQYTKICKTLSGFVNTQHAQIFTGSATLGNEVILSHLSALGNKGLILSNGEFGNRIIHQASCQKISFLNYKIEHGEVFNINYVEQLIANNVDIKWLYFVHCETSTGVLNDLNAITEICRPRNILICVDCVSTIGIIPLDLGKVYMAAASSGKAIGSFSGLSIVFFNNVLRVPENSIPVYLDIWHYINKNGIPFTLNSNALNALSTAVGIIDINSRYDKVREKATWLRNEILNLGLSQQNTDMKSLHPAIITIWLPESIDSESFGRKLEEKNILISYNSDYLLKQNSIQICLFSDTPIEDLKYFTGILKDILKSETVGSILEN
jgi:aspartate aminotransferase-like enzyme